MSPQYTSVYLMRIEDTDYYKIGISRNVGGRHRSIQSSMPFRVVLIRAVEREDAERVEEAIHAALNAYHVRGEWFACVHEEMCRVFDTYVMAKDSPSSIKEVLRAPGTGRLRYVPEAMITHARDLSENYGWSHRQIAAKLGITRTTVSHILNKKRRFSS